MEEWVKKAIETIRKIQPEDQEESEALRRTLYVLMRGKGWLTTDQPIKIFFFSDLT
jgi:hypothetical protein